jgi:hypothetical protein
MIASFLLRATALGLVCALGGCAGEPDQDVQGTAARHASLDRVVRWENEIRLEENEQTVNVIVRAELDPRGGYLIADEQEGFARRYAAHGKLLAQFAGKGSGPGEFQNLLRVLRLPNGTLAAFDIFNRAAIFDSAGERLVRATRTPVAPLHSVTLLNDSVLVLGGSLEGSRGEGRVHLWNLRSDSLLASFFSPVIPSRVHEIAAASAGWISVDRRGDTLAVVFALSDTVYLMTTQGRMLERIPIPAKHLRRLDPRAPAPDTRGGLAAARKWFGSFSMISDVFWLGDMFLIQYQDRKGPQPDWRLLGMTRRGSPRFEAVDTPHLVAVDRDAARLYFVAPGSDTPNEWRTARLASP